MKKKIIGGISALLVAGVLSIGATAPAMAGHSTGDWFEPRRWICNVAPWLC